MPDLPFMSKLVKFEVFDTNDILVFAKEVDASLSEAHGKEMLVTSHPVSRGIPVTDNIKATPRSFNMVAMFSNYATRIDDAVKKAVQGDSAKEAYEQFLDSMDKGWRFRIKTSLEVYENMVLAKVDVPRNSEKGNHVEIAMSFREIRKAKSQKTKLQPKRDSKQVKNDKGPQPKVKATPAQEKTWGAQIVDFTSKTLFGDK